jgi:ElaB/YqjD/DUF883 family membrane-anchored ribosome-binding protein
MNEVLAPNHQSDVPWPTSSERTRVPDTSMLPGSEQAPAPAAAALKSAVQAAHQTIDSLSERAAPAVQQLGEQFTAAEAALHSKTALLRDTRDAWLESARCTVRDKPLASLAAALGVGLVLARIMGRRR